MFANQSLLNALGSVLKLGVRGWPTPSEAPRSLCHWDLGVYSEVGDLRT